MSFLTAAQSIRYMDRDSATWIIRGQPTEDHDRWNCSYTWCVQVLRSPKEAFAAAMQSWRERCEKCGCLQGDYVEKLLHFQLPVVSRFLNKLGDLRT